MGGSNHPGLLGRAMISGCHSVPYVVLVQVEFPYPGTNATQKPIPTMLVLIGPTWVLGSHRF